MRNIKTIYILLFLSLLIIATKEASATFSIELNFYNVDFGNLNMGEIKEDIPPMGLRVTCTSDLGTPWYLKIRDERAFTHTLNPGSFIPNTNFYWYGVSTSTPGNNSLVRNQEDFMFEKTLYSALAGEGTNGTDITVKFKIVIPQYIQSGAYTTRVVFTMTE